MVLFHFLFRKGVEDITKISPKNITAIDKSNHKIKMKLEKPKVEQYNKKK